jgi:rRNA biogenesis protein RRP5
MCHISDVGDQLVKNLSEMYEPGDIVKALVLQVDEATKRIRMSLKPSHFKEEKYDEDDNEGGACGSLQGRDATWP